ncbi:MAG TPA: tetratricopeptide repeat protein [Candidatus Binatia bacterium]
MKFKVFFPLAFFLLAALPFLAWSAEENPRIKQAQEYLDAWKVSEAEAISAALLKETPRSAPALDLASQLSFYQGRYDDALRHIEQALAIDSANERRQALRLLAQQTRDRVGKMKRYESEHFILHLDEQKDGILAPYALDTLEKSHRALGQALGYTPPAKVRVEIAPDAVAFNAISTLSRRDIEETGAVGICKFNKIMTISPRVLLQGYRWLDSLSHEYLHYVIVGLSDNKAPIWLHEGTARFYETLWRHDKSRAAADYLTPANQTLLAQALAKNSFVGFKKMEPSLIYLETPEQVQLAYAEAASAVDFLVHGKGDAAVRELMSELKTRPTPEAIEKTTAKPYATFEAEWKAFLKAKQLKEIEGTRVRKLKVVGDQQKEAEEAVELKEIQSAVARNRTHLADQLLERGRAAAATEEYRRALQASPGSPIILNKLARVLIRQERYQEALPHLKRAQDLDPDSVGTYVQLGRLRHASKEFAAAKADLEEALQINPFNPEIHRLLSEVYGALGEQEQAKKARATLERLMKR